jgi:hypothetical protein
MCEYVGYSLRVSALSVEDYILHTFFPFPFPSEGESEHPFLQLGPTYLYEGGGTWNERHSVVIFTPPRGGLNTKAFFSFSLFFLYFLPFVVLSFEYGIFFPLPP